MTLFKKIRHFFRLNKNKLWGWIGNHEQRLNRLEEQIKRYKENKNG